MTLAVAIAEDGDVVVGLDSCTMADNLAIADAGKAPVRYSFDGHPDLLMASAGLSGIRTELAWRWSPPVPRGEEPLRYIAALTTSLRDHFTAGAVWSMSKDDEGRHLDGYFLAAWRGVVVQISGDFSLLRPASGCVVLGSGQDLALGALYATKGRPAEDRARIALEAAAELDTGVIPPFTICWAGR